MIEKLKTLIEIFFDKGKVNIRRRALRLVLSGSIVNFITITILSFITISLIWIGADRIGSRIGNSTAEYTSNYAAEETKKYLLEMVRERTKLINYEFENMVLYIEMMSRTMSKIMQEPQNYTPRKLPMANYEQVHSKELHVYCSPDIIKSGLINELQQEINIASNFADIMIPLSKHYDCVLAASEKGYVVRIDVLGENEIVPLSKEQYKTSYDARERPWYELGKKSSTAAFTEPFITTTTGEPCISCVMPYYDDTGIAGVVLIDCNAASIYEQIAKTKIGNTGFCFIVNEKGEVIYNTRQDENFSESITDTIPRMLADESNIETILVDGEEYYLAYAPMTDINWSLGTAISKAEVIKPAEEVRMNIIDKVNAFKGNLGYIFIILVSIFVVIIGFLISLLIKIGLRFSDKLVKPIQQLNNGVRKIASGNFDKKLDIHTGDEIEQLAESFNAMTDKLKTHVENLTKVTADKERIATELNVATNIQISMLPRDFNFNRDDFEIYATMNAAKAVGGDFYDFYLLDEHHLVITIADVSGKGVPAALFMSRSKTILKNFATMMTNPDDLAAVMTLSNNQLCQGNDEMMFVTVFMGLLDLTTGRFIYVNGGHNPPLVYHKSTDQFEYMDVKQNIVLAMMDEMDFEQQEIRLETGDILYLYTDGVTEAMDISNNQYGEERLSECLNNVDKNADLPTILKNVRDDLSDHVGEADQSDDITMLAVRVNEVKQQ
ncbi:MAG: SpoIIE family protein phosphatase [Selenomonadaceae bacterium]|nr:SpoIIE family protein phosphatase [Selenomonadaceae bacterium]